MASLTDLANAMGTDKGTQTGLAHGYTIVYDMLLNTLRHSGSLRVLEMGLAIGGPELGGDPGREVATAPSVQMWLEYFTDVQLVGFDISDFSRFESDRFAFVRGDSGNPEDVEQLLEHGPYDLILDDASHASYHQQVALGVLFGSLKPGGLYIIEDLAWQPEQYEATLPTVPRTSKLVAEMLAHGRCEPNAAISPVNAKRLNSEVSAIVMFDESTLNSLRDGYNLRRGLPIVQNVGWRASTGWPRLFSSRFWLFNLRRFSHSLSGLEGSNWQSTKLAVLQRATNVPLFESEVAQR